MGYSPPSSSVLGISQEEYWSEFPFPSWQGLPDPGIKPLSLALTGDSLPPNYSLPKVRFYWLHFFFFFKSELKKKMTHALKVFLKVLIVFIRIVLLMEKEMATHSSTLAWRIPWVEEPGSLQSTGSRRVRNDWATSLSLFAFMHWWKKWQPTPVFLPGESQGQKSLVGCRLWDRIESDTTEAT